MASVTAEKGRKTMSRLIDAELIENGIATYLLTNAYLNDTAQGALEMVYDWIREAPSEEIVLCEDCYYYNADGYCGFWGESRHPEHYCGEGVENG
jgi:hypothetical protein